MTSEKKYPEPLEKGLLRARYNLTIFKDGTIRYDLTNAPITHFTPAEIRGNPVDEILPDEVIELINELDKTKTNIEEEIDAVLKDNRKAPMDVSISLLEDDDNSFLG